MAHCSYKDLADLKNCLAEIHQWPGIVESRPGVFYLGQVAFLHFHLTDGIRSADVRAGKDWDDRVDTPIGASAAAQKRFLSELRRRYKATSEFLGLRSKEAYRRFEPQESHRPRGNTLTEREFITERK